MLEFVDGEPTAATLKLLNGYTDTKGTEHKGIFASFKEELPVDLCKVHNTSSYGLPGGGGGVSDADTQLTKYLDKVTGKSPGFSVLSPTMDVLALTRDRGGPYAGLNIIAHATRSHLTVRPANSDTEGTFSGMGRLHSALRNAFTPETLHALTVLSADASASQGTYTRKVAVPWSQAEVATLCLGGMPRRLAIASVKKAMHAAAAVASSSAQSASSSSSSSSSVPTMSSLVVGSSASASVVEEEDDDDDDGDFFAAMLEAAGDRVHEIFDSSGSVVEAAAMEIIAGMQPTSVACASSSAGATSAPSSASATSSASAARGAPSAGAASASARNSVAAAAAAAAESGGVNMAARVVMNPVVPLAPGGAPRGGGKRKREAATRK